MLLLVSVAQLLSQFYRHKLASRILIEEAFTINKKYGLIKDKIRLNHEGMSSSNQNTMYIKCQGEGEYGMIRV